MTNDKLADEISRQLFARDDDSVSLNEDQWQQIIAALRRQTSEEIAYNQRLSKAEGRKT